MQATQTVSVLTAKGRKQIIRALEHLTDDQLLTEYRALVEAKRWDEARLAKQEMRERGLA